MSYNVDTGMYEGYIYLILNDISPEQIYVGQTITTPQLRWNQHLRQVKEHSYTDKLHNKMGFYGTGHFGLDIIETCYGASREELIEKLDEREIYYISLFDSYNNGLNMTRGGRNGVDHVKRPVIQYDLYGKQIAEFESVDDLKKHLSKTCVSSIYACCYDEIKYAYGFVWRYKGDELNKYPLPTDSEVNEANIRIKSLGKIKQYSLVGDLVRIYSSINDAVNATNVSRRQIVWSCSGTKVTGGNFVWRFEEDDFDSLKNNREKFKQVFQYDKNLNLINVYPSTREASRVTGVCRTSIGNACRGDQRVAGGFLWSYQQLNNISY